MSQHIVKNRIQMYFELKKKEITNSRIFHSSRRKKISVEFEKYIFLKKEFALENTIAKKGLFLKCVFSVFFEVYSFHLLFLSPCGIRHGKIKRLGENKTMT